MDEVTEAGQSEGEAHQQVTRQVQLGHTCAAYNIIPALHISWIYHRCMTSCGLSLVPVPYWPNIITMRVFVVIGYQTGPAGSHLQCGLQYISCAQYFTDVSLLHDDLWALIGNLIART